MVEVGGSAPPSTTEVVSNIYITPIKMVTALGLEPRTLGLENRCSNPTELRCLNWWARSDLNRHVTRYEHAALPVSHRPTNVYSPSTKA